MGNYIISKQLHRNIWRAMYLDTLSGSLLLNCQNTNERDILKHFQTISCLRHLIDEVQDPPLLVLERLDGNLLIESGTKPSILRSRACCKGCFTSSSIAWGGDCPYSCVKNHGYNINYGDSGSRFSDVKLAHCGDSTHVDFCLGRAYHWGHYLLKPWSDA